MPSTRRPSRRRAWIKPVAIWTAVFGVLAYGTIGILSLYKGPSTRSISLAPMPYASGVLAFEHARGRLPVLRSGDWPVPLGGPRVGGSGTVADVPALLLRGSRVVQWGSFGTPPVSLDTRRATLRRGKTLLVYVPRAVLTTPNGRYRGYVLEIVDTRARNGAYGPLVTTCTVWSDPPVEECTVQAPDASIPVLPSPPALPSPARR
jgi:hypothetical protein